MELRHLRYFIKSAELLHFTDAAAALRVSQPNLSLQIQQLEDEIGSQLFERLGRAVRLTAAGELFLEYALKAMSEVEAGQQGVQDLKGVIRGPFRIGMTSFLGPDLFPGMLAEFLAINPALYVSVNTGTNRWVEAGLRAGELDLALVSRFGKAGDFNSRELFPQHIVIVVSRNHRLAGSKALRISDLEGELLALPTADSSLRQRVDAAFAAAHLDPRVIVESNDLNVLTGLARRGAAATILTCQAAAGLPAAGLSRVRLNEKGVLLTAAFLWPRGVDSVPAIASFLELAGRSNFPDPCSRISRK